MDRGTGALVRVLVVDDDEPLLRMVKLSLTVAGLDVVTATNGPAAIEMVEQLEPDVIVLDLQMPGMDGRAVFRALRDNGATVPVLILSAFGAPQACKDLGAEAAMEKPFDPDALAQKVRALAAQELRANDVSG